MTSDLGLLKSNNAHEQRDQGTKNAARTQVFVWEGRRVLSGSIALFVVIRSACCPIHMGYVELRCVAGMGRYFFVSGLCDESLTRRRQLFSINLVPRESVAPLYSDIVWLLWVPCFDCNAIGVVFTKMMEEKLS